MRIALLLLLVACRSGEGESCEDHADCQGRLVCKNGRCGVSDAVYKEMAKQSGIGSNVVEKPLPRASGPGSVHVRTAWSEDVALAICAPNERLTGGWCDPPGEGGDDTSLSSGGAEGYTDEDTVGARWKCKYSGKQIRAYALCQVISE